MIGADIDAAKAIATDLSASCNFSALGQALARHCDSLITTVADPDFPGAVVPNLGEEGDLRVFVVATDKSTWRQLNSVLRAFAGPTISSFDGLPSSLPQGDRAAEILRQCQPVSTAVMRLPSDQLLALRALERARETLARAPKLQRSAPEPTSLLLARFQDHLNVGRPDAAAEILARLRQELRVDSLNLKFLEIQHLATFSRWRSILDLPELTNLCQVRRPPAVTALLLEAFYRNHLAEAFDDGDIDATRSLYESKVRPLAKSMLTTPAPATLTPEGWRLYGLEAWIAASRTDLLAELVDRRDELGWIAEKVDLDVDQNGPAVDPLPIDKARSALVEIDSIESIDSLAKARAALSMLTSDELAQLRHEEMFRPALQVADDAADVGIPTSWIEWLAMAADPAFKSALDMARRGKDEWPISAAAGDPVDIQDLISALNRTQDNELAAERTAQALPFIVAWLRRDPDFPRATLTPIYASLLTLTALGPARGDAVYESSGILVSALLNAGLDARGYHALMDDILEIAGDGFGVNMVYWMLEIIEDVMRSSTPDADAREAFLHDVLCRIKPIYARLSSLQRTAIAELAKELGWALPSIGVDADIDATDDFAKRIEESRIAIYSLTEAASQRAKDAIQEIAPRAVVDCNADHGGTAQLRALAENADLFVVAWRSAKHAATDFIRKHRSNRPLLYAEGKGFSSILRTLQDHLSKSKN